MTALMMPDDPRRPPPRPLDLVALRAGDPEALDACYRQHAPELLTLALRLTASRSDAEDVVHDLFVGLPEALAHYEERGKFGAWLARIVVRLVLLRQRAARRNSSTDALDEIAAPELPGSDAWLRQRLMEALRTLSPALRHVFVLRAIHGYSHAEIGVLLEITPGTSEVRLHRATRELRTLLGDVV